MFSQHPSERIMHDYAHLPVSAMRLCPIGRSNGQIGPCHMGRSARPIYRVAIYARGDENDIVQQVLHCQLALAPLLEWHPLLTSLYTDPNVMALPDSMCMEEPSGLWRLLDNGVHDVFDIVVVNSLDRLTDGKPTLYDEVVDSLLDFGLTILAVDEGCVGREAMTGYCAGREDIALTAMPQVVLERF